MQRLLAGVTEAVSGALGIGSQTVSRKDDPSYEQEQERIEYESSVTTSATRASHAAARVEEDGQEVQEVQEVQEIAAPTGSKRTRGAAGEDGGLKKKLRQAPSEDERRLTGNYSVPKDAKAIFVPRPSWLDEEDEQPRAEEPTAVKKMPSRVTGGYKPMNTLDQDQYAAKGLFSKFGRGQKPSNGQLPTSTSRGSNITIARPRQGEGFDHEWHVPSPNGANKKRKLNSSPTTNAARNARSHPTVSTGPVINIDVDDAVSVPVSGKVIARNGKSVGKSSQSSITALSDRSDTGNRTSFLHQPFDQHEARKVDQRMAIPGEKKRRRRYDSRDSHSHPTSTSATPSSADLTTDNGVNGEKRGTRHMPVELEVVGDDAPTKSGMGASSAASAHHRPPIDLERDMPVLKKPAAIKRGADEAQAANDALAKSLGPPKQLNVERVENWSERNGRSTQLRREIKQIEPDRSFASHLPQPGHLRTTFVRDQAGPAPQSRQKATQRMQATSKTSTSARVSPIGDSSDELAGGTTVGSQASGSVSPAKKVRTVASVVLPSADYAVERAASPSDLRATQFSRPKKGPTKVQPRASPVQESEASEEEPIRIPIRSIYSRACVLNQQEIELVWDEESKLFYVECGGQLQKIPNQLQLVNFGKREASHSWVYATTSLTVHIKGSMTPCSNGSTIIQFLSSRERDLCYDCFFDATNDRLPMKKETEERMQGIFNNLVATIQVDYKAQNQKSKAEAERALLATNKPVLGGRKWTPEEDRIKYDDGDEEPSEHRTTARDRMQGDLLSNSRAASRTARSDRTIVSSPFFVPKVRKSTRQTKPIKPRSPTPPPPERWTQIHNPPKWPHGVVYPPTGARRVTVDFSDLARLDEGEFLNDNVIGFALRQIEERMSPEFKESVHFFNSFFYTSLTTKNGRKAFNYEGVKKWTKNKDLFNLPFVVVPINIDLHWFVAIICNLDHLARKPAGSEEVVDDEAPDTPARKETPELADGAEDDAVIQDSQEQEAKKAQDETDEKMRDLSIVDEETSNADVYAFGDNGKVTSARGSNAPEDMRLGNSRPRTASTKKSKGRRTTSLQKLDPDQPVVITLDSFGSSHTSEVANLKDYLSAEGEAKRGMHVARDMLKGLTAKGIPEQTNFCDCGLFLVGYVEQFAKNPRKFVQKVLSREMDQESDFGGFDPSAKRAEIREAMLKLQEEQEAEYEAKKQGKPSTMQADKQGNPSTAQTDKQGKPSTAQADKEVRAGQHAVDTAAEAVKREVAPHNQYLEKATDPAPSTEPPAVKLTNEDFRREQHATTAHATKTDDEGDDEIEVAVPHAVGQSLLSPRRSFGKPTAESPVSSPVDQDTARSQEDEMLDENETNRQDGDKVDTVAVGSPLLDELEACLSQDLTRTNPSGAADAGKTAGGEEVYTRPTGSIERDGVAPDVEPTYQRTADNAQPDQRTPAVIVDTSPLWKGKHTHFQDD